MSIFDLLFLALFFTAVLTTLAAGWYALLGKYGQARRTLARLAAGIAAYFCVVILVSLVLPRKTFGVGSDQCFDDWCIGVSGFKAVPENASIAYTVDLRLKSRARRVSQREKNLSVYLTDDQGKRYEPEANKSVGRFDVLLRPGEAAAVSRSYVVPAGAKHVGVVIAHEGGFPIGWFIIGYDTWFRKPAIVPLN